MTVFLAALFAGCWGCGWVLAFRLSRPRDEAKIHIESQRNYEESSFHQGLSVIIPARNEAHNLPRLLDSLRDESPCVMEILVVDDGSTDGTSEVAKAHGARVLTAEPLPSDWRGKTWACHQGATVASGDTLLFLDADTWFEPGGLRKLLAAHEVEVYSVSPFHRISRPYEWFSLFFNFCMASGTVPSGLSGQCLRVKQNDYWRVGGHEAVRGEILENFVLASRFRQGGLRVRCLPGKGFLAFRMYPGGWGEMIEGWTKGFAAGAGGTGGRELATVVFWMTGLMLPLLGVTLGLPHGLNLAGWGLGALQVAWLGRMVGNFPAMAALAYPFALVFFFAVFARSALKSGKNVTWKGREIDVH